MPPAPRPRGAAWNSLRAIVLAEESECARCGRPVDMDAPARSPSAPEVNHRVPLHQGGAPLDRDNVELMHKRCNVQASNEMRTHHPTPSAVFSRDW